MDVKSMKNVAEWLRETVFQDEAIRPREAPSSVKLPPLLRTARSLESGIHQRWQSREGIFLQQARLLADYEDDYDYQGNVRCYYPTYQSLTDQELRGYFTWRTEVRRGEVRRAPTPFAFLYVYELINQAGVQDPEDGYRKLVHFQDAYGRLDDVILPYLRQWLVDYVIYYDLDRALLAESTQVRLDRSVAALDDVENREPAEIAAAVRLLSPQWLERSKFYAAYRAEMDEVIARVLRRMSAHYAARCKKSLTEQYFGDAGVYRARPFETAVFCDPLKRRHYEYAVDEQCICCCDDGVWFARKRVWYPDSGKKLTPLLKTIDAEMRQAFAYRYPVKAALDTKWILKIIREEIQALLAEKQAAEERKVEIDYTQLTRIRQDAAITQEKLIVEEEEAPALPEEEPAEEPAASGDMPLSSTEVRLLRCLLYGGDTGWVQEEGHLLSVLVDGINEKLYDIFGDTVLEDGVVEDYIDDLKEMVRP